MRSNNMCANLISYFIDVESNCVHCLVTFWPSENRTWATHERSFKYHHATRISSSLWRWWRSVIQMPQNISYSQETASPAGDSWITLFLCCCLLCAFAFEWQFPVDQRTNAWPYSFIPSACKSVQNDRFLAICYAVCWWSLLVQNYEELTLANSFVSRNKQSYEVSVVAAEGRLFPEWTLWTYPFSVTIFTFSGNSFLVTTKYKIYMLCTPINHAL